MEVKNVGPIRLEIQLTPVVVRTIFCDEYRVRNGYISIFRQLSHTGRVLTEVITPQGYQSMRMLDDGVDA